MNFSLLSCRRHHRWTCLCPPITSDNRIGAAWCSHPKTFTIADAEGLLAVGKGRARELPASRVKLFARKFDPPSIPRCPICSTRVSCCRCRLTLAQEDLPGVRQVARLLPLDVLWGRCRVPIGAPPTGNSLRQHAIRPPQRPPRFPRYPKPAPMGRLDAALQKVCPRHGWLLFPSYWWVSSRFSALTTISR